MKLRTSKRSVSVDCIAIALVWTGALLIICLLFGLIGYVLVQGLPVIDWQFLTRPASTLTAGGGIGPQLWNSLYLLLLTLLITIPISIAGGIYLAEYAKPGRLLPLIQTSIETLASLPSIVVGLFGLLVFVDLADWGYSMIAGVLTISILTLPIMFRVSEDAFRAVPKNLQEGALALGASRFEAITHTVLPAAFPSLITGVVLTAGRVFGEAAALLYTAGLVSPPLNFGNWDPTSVRSPFSLFRPAETLAVHIWKVNAEGLVPDLDRVANGSAAVLILAVLLFNTLARTLARRIHKRLSGIR